MPIGHDVWTDPSVKDLSHRVRWLSNMSRIRKNAKWIGDNQLKKNNKNTEQGGQGLTKARDMDIVKF